MSSPQNLPRLSRRSFLGLSAGLGLGGLLAACGGSGSSSGASTDSSLAGTTGTLPQDVQLIQRFPNTGLVPGNIRLPISLADSTGILSTPSLPSQLAAKVIDVNSGKTVIANIAATKHDAGIPSPYWPFALNITSPGYYSLVVDGGPTDGAAFQVQKRSDVAMPLVGDALPPFDTPTTSNHRGVNPVCSRKSGVCPFHSVTLREALTMGKPVAYIIGTPAYCQTGSCAPALDALIDAHTAVGDKAVFVHADVYTDSTASKVAPAVEAYHLDFEPVLYITDAKGVLQHRLDAVFDTVDVRAALSAVGVN